jgi:hypothetical protein
VRGWTITPASGDDEAWETVKQRVADAARPRGLETAFVESNALSMLDHSMLLAEYKRHLDGGWYSAVGHGLGLLGLCAPLAYARGLTDLYMAATHWRGIDLAWGSRPDIDDHVRWTGTRCHHDGYDLTRQERIDAIATYARQSPHPLTLQTCNDQFDGNCGACEKCYRTAIGLDLAGLDPRTFGYPFDHGDYPRVRKALEDGAWILGEDERHMWADIRARATETDLTSPEQAAFFAWLEHADLEQLIERARRPLHHRLLRAGARNAPQSVYTALYPVWTVAKDGYQKLTAKST